MEFNFLTPEFSQAAALEPKRAARWPVDRHAAVRVAGDFEASPERVFDAWLDPRIAGKWLFATASRPVTRVTIDPRVGGSFRFADRKGGGAVEHTGEYLEIVRPWRLVFTLALEGNPKARTRVTTEILPRDGGCGLTLIHENVPPEHASRIEARWTGMLYGLGVTLDQQPGRPKASAARKERATPMKTRSRLPVRIACRMSS